jgi:hypothetical protein
MLIKQFVILSISCGLLACASSTEGPDGEHNEARNSRSNCIFRSSIRGYSVLDESNLIIDASGRHEYHVVLYRRAIGIRSSWSISFDSRDGRICPGFSEVIFDGHLDNESIRISSIRRITPAEHDDLLIQFGLKEPEIQQTPAPNAVKGAEVAELDPAAADDSSGD